MSQYENRSSYNTNRPPRNFQDGITKIIKVPEYDSPELLGSDAEKLAIDVAKDTGLTKSQIRNFYSEIKSIERLLDTNSARWPELFNRVKLVKAKAIYNKKRVGLEKSFGPFSDFLGLAIDRIKNDEQGMKHFKIFCQLFEAFVGYSSEYAKER